MEYYILTQILYCALICAMLRDIFTVVRTACFVLYCNVLSYILCYDLVTSLH
jgi:hypothetical protein